jgi:hypothetical protein
MMPQRGTKKHKLCLYKVRHRTERDSAGSKLVFWHICDVDPALPRSVPCIVLAKTGGCA